jgi:hypothetical protein
VILLTGPREQLNVQGPALLLILRAPLAALITTVFGARWRSPASVS